MRTKIIIGALALAVVAVAILAGIGSMGAPAGEGAWEFFSDRYYTAITAAAGDPVLAAHWQDSGFESVQNATGEGAGMEEGVFPDVRTLRIQEPVSEGFNISVESHAGMVDCEMLAVDASGKVVVVPKNINEMPIAYANSPDGQAYVATEKGIWRVYPGGSIERISPEHFGGEHIDTVISRFVDMHGENYLSWNMNIVPSPDGIYLAYASNKNDVGNAGSALFALNTQTGEEMLLAHAAGTGFLPEGWIDDETIICLKVRDGVSAVAVNMRGEAAELPLRGGQPYVYAAQYGLIAYVADISDPKEMAIARFGGKSGLEELARVNMDGQIRPGSSFSPDGAKLACKYLPDAYSDTALMMLVDLRAKKSEIIDLPPEAGPNASVREFSWIDAVTLLVNIYSESEGVEAVTTWIYKV
ncbi:MAG: hypothetical protein LBH39_02615 [Clostridiales Family XIII bacterium]|jgi:hypothetical protein|nr:hypothetical protein [Clostridiales Family XIII bacterium]